MSKIKGKAIYVKVNTGTEGSPVWTKVGGQLSAEMPRTRETIEVTDKDSDGWKEFLGGNASWEISLESFMKDGDAGIQEIEAAYEAGTEKMFQFLVEGEGTYQGKAFVTELNISGEEADAGKVSFSLQGTSSVVKS